MEIKKTSSRAGNSGSPGFSLVELLVVVAILGILSIAAAVNINSAKVKLKAFVFNTKTRFNQARFEAVKRSRDVYIDFDFNAPAGIDDRFTIWVDENDDGLYLNDPGDGDVIIDEPVVFKSQSSIGEHGPAIYSSGISGGPGNDGPDTKTIGDGVSAAGDRFMFQPNGDSNGGTVYFYFSQDDDGGGAVKSGPWAIIVNPVGRIRVDEWNSSRGWEVDE